MAIAYGSPDLVAHLSVVYVCECGRQVAEHGLHAGELPPGWVASDEGRCLCAYCARRQREADKAGRLR